MDLVESALSYGSDSTDLFKAKIVVCGIGGGGSNTVQHLIKARPSGVNVIAVNTDAKHLNTMAPDIKRVLIGGALTRGLGAGGFPEMGAKAAEYSRMDIEKAMGECDLCFVTAGMGGGTGSGATKVVAQVAKNSGAIVVGIVTFPFQIERVRLKTAQKAIDELRQVVDTLIVIDNQRLFEVYSNLAMEQAFKVADEITVRAVKGISDTINAPGLINVDFADIRTVMGNGGLAMISVGEGHGTDKINEVVRSTLKNKLLDVDYEGTTGIMLYIKGGDDLTLGDANTIATKLTEKASPNANVIWGARIDPAYNDRIEVVAIFTGVKSPQILAGGAVQKKKGDGWGLDDL